MAAVVESDALNPDLSIRAHGRLPCLFLLATAAVLVFVPAGSPPARATPEYAKQTGQPCLTCHLSEKGGVGLNASGEAFLDDPSAWSPPTAPPKAPAATSLARRLFRLLILYVHIFFGVVWVGTILYVHLVLKPQYAIGGLPKSELRLAWLSMPLIAASGLILTWMRLSGSPGMLATRYGLILQVKAGIFSAMLISATFVTAYIGPRLRRLAESHHQDPPSEPGGSMTADQLASLDGKEGRKALIAVEGAVYDVSSSRLWKAGRHAGRHAAGRDLTEELGQAPHGREVLDHIPVVAKIAAGKPPASLVVRLFIANAYFNLTGCFAIILCLVLWRL